MMDIDTYRTPRRQPPSRFFPLEAEELLRGGEVENATELCKRGLIYFPENISGYAVLAQAYMLLGQDERAINVLEGGYRRTGADGLQTLRRMMAGENLPALMGFHVQPIEPEETSEQNTIKAIEENVEEVAPPEASTEVESVDSVRDIGSREGTDIEAESAQISEEAEVQIGTENEIEAEATEADTIEEQITEIATVEEATVEEATSVQSEEDAVEENAIEEDVSQESVIEETAVAEDAIVEAVEDAADGETTPAESGQESKEIATVEEESATTEAEELQSPVDSEPAIEPEKSLSEFSIPEEIEPIDATAGQGTTTPEIAGEDTEGAFSIALEEAPPVELTQEAEPEQATPPELEQPESRQEAGTKRSEEKGTVKHFRQGGLSLHSGTKISRLSSSNLRLIPGLEFAPLRRDDDLKIRIAPLVSEELSDVKMTFDSIIPGIPSEVSERQPSAPLLPEPLVSDADVADTEMDNQPVSGTTSFHKAGTVDFDKAERIEHLEEEESVDLFPEIPSPDTPEIGSQSHQSEPEIILPLHIAQSGQGHHGTMTPLEELARRLETARIPIVEEEEDDSYDSPAFEPSIVSDTFAAILVGQRAYAEAIKAYQMLARMKPERREEYDKKIAEIRWKMSSV